jgi:two-component system, OmpR family, alkaline phosphatase synthesis response regulator PhoP
MMNEPKPKIFVVDDEPQILKVLTVFMENAGFDVVVSMDGRTAFSTFQKEHPDFVVLDLNLPGMDGLEVCRAIRKESAVPILMLTARSEEADKLIGLEIGADDYIVKPFSPREIVARIRTIFRRTRTESEKTEIIQVDDLIIDTQKHTVRLGDQYIELTLAEFEILTILARQPRRVFSRTQIMDSAQYMVFEGFDRTIDAHIKNIRIKMEPNPRKPIYIQTVFGLGYKLDMGKDA